MGVYHWARVVDRVGAGGSGARFFKPGRERIADSAEFHAPVAGPHLGLAVDDRLICREVSDA
jgi:hypothetical protein